MPFPKPEERCSTSVYELRVRKKNARLGVPVLPKASSSLVPLEHKLKLLVFLTKKPKSQIKPCLCPFSGVKVFWFEVRMLNFRKLFQEIGGYMERAELFLKLSRGDGGRREKNKK
jgi:hypothetical protein